MNDAMLMIVATEAKARIEGKTFATVEEKLKEAMRATKDHWGVTDEQMQFKAAIAAVLLDKPSPEDKARIEEELNVLKMLGAAMQGIPVDFSQMVPPEKPLGLNKLWQDVKAEVRTS